MNLLEQKATELARKISEQYNLLDIDNKFFFNRFHDELQIQKDCAWDTVRDVSYAIEMNNDFIEAEINIATLVDTLKYMKAVIKIQSQIKKLPSPIFG